MTAGETTNVYGCRGVGVGVPIVMLNAVGEGGGLWVEIAGLEGGGLWVWSAGLRRLAAARSSWYSAFSSRKAFTSLRSSCNSTKLT